MNKIVAIVILFIIIAGGIWYGVSRHGGNSSIYNPPATSQPAQSSQTSATPEQTDKVTIANMSFSPADISIKTGTKVTWTNQDAVNHTVTENDGKTGPDSSPLGQGQSYSFTFSQPGTYHYHCSIHSEMTGTVTVQ